MAKSHSSVYGSFRLGFNAVMGERTPVGGMGGGAICVVLYGKETPKNGFVPDVKGGPLTSALHVSELARS